MIFVFEQDYLHIDEDPNAVLNDEYIRLNLSEERVTENAVEYEDNKILIMQAIDEDDGESWKFIQMKRREVYMNVEAIGWATISLMGISFFICIYYSYLLLLDKYVKNSTLELIFSLSPIMIILWVLLYLIKLKE
jgi:hypothetical protein